ncbi:RIP metalloprotease RseP [Candidatus Giovannonibacteria bacterium RIFCSPLOWO2_01_FULL_46_13]|uniref:Zinc metalloprotease n=1 Tax=Candidatus Giovannonibacteria bacterium RIFCSPLOWO2_01_FULL_46_13 TaxID=1798352 RepID=A0A1F5X3N3_9BACT|nr:MAG: RIP metalloprotease RseP [Candidatus Giovannonibacteria bacterium RIFCSPLOWO2_01_FULL_46_13]
MFLTILIFLVILLILVLAHEFGHFLFAKLAKVKVEEFAFGFPPRLASIQKGETKYSFNLLPLGGYVKIQGEEGEDSADPRSFSAQRFWIKILIIAAGVGFNLILAYILFTSGFIMGTPVPLDDNDANPNAEVRITEVQEGSPAEAAGLLPGDRLLSIAGEEGESLPVFRIDEVQNFIQENKGKKISINYERAGGLREGEAVVREDAKPGEGALGIAMVRTGIEKSGFFEALKKGFEATVSLTALTAEALWGFFSEIFTGKGSFEGVSGPIGIVNIVGDFSRFGLVYLIQLTALLSINLALINIIPFPGLDGGRIFFLILEKIKGSPFHWKFTRTVHAAGFVLLILLMILVTYHDIISLNS